MSSSSDDDDRGEETWDDFDGEDAKEEEEARPSGLSSSLGADLCCAPQLTRCLFSDAVLPSPAAALQRAAETFGFDFARLRLVRGAAACLPRCKRH